MYDKSSSSLLKRDKFVDIKPYSVRHMKLLLSALGQSD